SNHPGDRPVSLPSDGAVSRQSSLFTWRYRNRIRFHGPMNGESLLLAVLVFSILTGHAGCDSGVGPGNVSTAEIPVVR
ncbi:MAG: hypothetical protein R3178_09765, partial [Rhodothermales bacterium]|nr:hypothetical protein [Rhodothermales bacterium]